MPTKFVVARVQPGTAPPMGYTFVRNLRGVDIYQMQLPEVTPVDQLAELFGNMGMGPGVIGVVEANGVDELTNMINGLNMGGRRRKTRKNRRKSQRK